MAGNTIENAFQISGLRGLEPVLKQAGDALIEALLAWNVHAEIRVSLTTGRRSA